MRLSEARREALLERLSAAYAAEALDASEYELRVARLLTAVGEDEARAVLQGLKDGGADGGAEAGGRGRGRGHGEQDVPDPDWAPTGERFRDPRSGRVMRVWVDARGGRHYIAEGAA